jgi:hypothetical protein
VSIVVQGARQVRELDRLEEGGQREVTLGIGRGGVERLEARVLSVGDAQPRRSMWATARSSWPSTDSLWVRSSSSEMRP